MGLTVYRSACRWLISGVILAVLAISPVLAQQGVYTASGIAVDMTGDIATLREQAMLEGQRQGLRKVLSEIAPADQAAQIALPPDDVISGWVQDFAIEEEKTSATRYIGRFTFRFLAEPVQQLLADQGIAFAQTQGKRLLVLPVLTDATGSSVLWGPGNQWLSAWSSRPPESTLIKLMAPRGDLDDISSVSAVEALGGDANRLREMGQRYGAGDVAVSELRLSPLSADGSITLDLSVTQYGSDGVKHFTDQLTGPGQDIDSLYRQAVERTASLIQGAWKDENLIDASQENEIVVDVPVTDLKEWVAIKKHLGGVQGLKGVRLVSLTRSLAILEMSYVGTPEQFARSLAQQDLALSVVANGEGVLKLDPNAGAAALQQQSEPAFGSPPDTQMPQPQPPSEDGTLMPETPVVPQ